MVSYAAPPFILAGTAATRNRPLTLVIGLAKSGTTSVHRYFECNGWRSSHWGCGDYSCATCVLDFVRKVGLVQMKRELPTTNRSYREPKCLSWRGWTFPAFREPGCAVNYPDLQSLFQSSCGPSDMFSQIDAPQHFGLSLKKSQQKRIRKKYHSKKEL